MEVSESGTTTDTEVSQGRLTFCFVFSFWPGWAGGEPTSSATRAGTVTVQGQGAKQIRISLSSSVGWAHLEITAPMKPMKLIDVFKILHIDALGFRDREVAVTGRRRRKRRYKQSLTVSKVRIFFDHAESFKATVYEDPEVLVLVIYCLRRRAKVAVAVVLLLRLDCVLCLCERCSLLAVCWSLVDGSYCCRMRWLNRET